MYIKDSWLITSDGANDFIKVREYSGVMTRTNFLCMCNS